MALALSNTTQQSENLETYSLIWLDTSVNNSEENIQAQKQLRTSINHLVTFEDDQQCFEYIQSISEDDRIILIVSGRLGQIIVPEIVKYRQIVSIYVYCMNKKANEDWANQFKKVKAIIVELDELIQRIHTDQHQRKHTKIDESLPICIINSNDGDHRQSTIDLSGQYLHSQLLIDCLITMKSNINEKNELISLCKQRYEGNSDELNIVEEFEREYSSDWALWWYTRDSFLYQMLNKALRVQNIHLLFLFRFLIRDIEQQLEKNKCVSPVRVYRAQLMSNDEVQMLKDSLGELIAINSFFSTSLDKQRARSFFSSDDNSNDLERIFFEIDADPRLDNIKPFSDIHIHSYYPEEQEVLFMIGSIFQLVNISRDKDGLLIVRMKLCSLNDHHLKVLFQHMQKKPQNGETGLLHFAHIIKNMGKLDDAERYCYHLLNECSDNSRNTACCYHELGSVAKKKGDYESSLKFYNKSLEINLQILKSNDINIGNSHNSIGAVYEAKKEYVHALESYEKALAIYRQAFGEDHQDVAMCMNNIGNIYRHYRKYSEALELYEKALSIREKNLSVNHPELGQTHKNIGNTHADLNQSDLALSHYKLSLKIYKKCLPSQHPSIATTLRCVGLTYEDKRDFEQALSYFEEAAKISRRSLSSTHPDAIRIEKDIQRLSSKME